MAVSYTHLCPNSCNFIAMYFPKRPRPINKTDFVFIYKNSLADYKNFLSNHQTNPISGVG